MGGLSQQVKQLLKDQVTVWELARKNYAALEQVQVKSFSFGDSVIRVQYNPARIQSSAAKVDTKSIQERKCFLCPANLPEVQQGIPFGEEYQILINPFPIFPEHFTIPDYQHTDQRIKGRYGDMLDLAQVLHDYVVFYNGPKCGASAPDHLHFQAGNKGFLPLEQEIRKTDRERLLSNDGCTIYRLKDTLRNGFLVEATAKFAAVSFFDRLYEQMEVPADEPEPRMNILTWYEKTTWYSVIFPREKHCPDCYFAEGEANCLISPASVDLGGVFITPLEKDFRNITAGRITQILSEITITDEKMDLLAARVQHTKMEK
ncbi:MAG: DUF4922 domain-containing protein [Tannerellaceae bacterium]|nr:DUF4922 domain-containing protein [Tannerellaceae bacterium]